MLRPLLKRLRSSQIPSDLVTRFEASLGREVVEALVRADVLQSVLPLDWHPCPGFGDRCPRRTQPNPAPDGPPWVATSPQPGLCCDTLELTDDEVRGLVFNLDGFARELRRVFLLNGPANLREEVLPRAWRIGRHQGGGLTREALLCTDLRRLAAAPALRVRLSQRRPTLVLAHALQLDIPEWLHDHRAPSASTLEIVFLDEVLTLRGGRVALQDGLESSPQSRPAVSTAQAEPFCVLIDADGARPIGEAECEAVRASAGELDIFIDALTVTRKGRIYAHRRTREGVLEERPLTHQQAWVLIELIERRRPTRATELSVLSSYGSPDKQVEAARRELDVRLGRYEWRYFHTLRGEDKLAKHYVFRPPAGMTYAALVSQPHAS